MDIGEKSIAFSYIACVTVRLLVVLCLHFCIFLLLLTKILANLRKYLQEQAESLEMVLEFCVTKRVGSQCLAEIYSLSAP